MAAFDSDAWWDSLPDQIEEWGAPRDTCAGGGNASKRKSSGEKASLEAFLVRPDHSKTPLRMRRESEGRCGQPIIGAVDKQQGSSVGQQLPELQDSRHLESATAGNVKRDPPSQPLPLSQEQRERIEANRLAALRRRNAAAWFQAGGNPLQFGQQTAYAGSPPVPNWTTPVAEPASCQSKSEALVERMVQQTGLLESNTGSLVIGSRIRHWERGGQQGALEGGESVTHSMKNAVYSVRSEPLSIPASLVPAVADSLTVHQHQVATPLVKCGSCPISSQQENLSKSGTDTSMPVPAEIHEVNASSLRASADFEVPEDFWDGVDSDQPSRETETKAALEGVIYQEASGMLINSAALQMKRGDCAQPPHFNTSGPHSHHPATCQPQPPAPRTNSHQPHGIRLVPKPLEVTLELFSPDRFSMEAQYAFCDPPAGCVFKPVLLHNAEVLTRSIAERAFPGVKPQEWIPNEGQDETGILIFSVRHYDKLLRGLPKLQEVKVKSIPESTLRALRNRWTSAAVPASNAPHKRRRVNKLASTKEKGMEIGGTSEGTSEKETSIDACAAKKRPCESSWQPLRTGHIRDDEVDVLMEQGLPEGLKEALLPFQKEGVRYALQRGGRCLIADEMGVGKTIQAIAIASCYREEWPLLVVVPASMRLPWAEELERWLPFLNPKDVHLVFGSRDDLEEGEPCPKVVVISYNMLRRLRQTFLMQKWGVVIMDESHNLRTTKSPTENEEKETLREIITKTKRAILLSGTPSLTRPFDIFNQVDSLWPGLLGRNKYAFGKVYCDVQTISKSRTAHVVKDYSKGSRLRELHVLLAETVMVRRLKCDVLDQLPPKRRQVIRLKLEPFDITEAKERTAEMAAELQAAGKGRNKSKLAQIEAEMMEEEREERGELDDVLQRLLEGQGGKEKDDDSLTYHQIGLAKLRGVTEWLASNVGLTPGKENESEAIPKMIIFAHHIEVLDRLQRYVHSCGVEYVRIDGSTLGQDRQVAVKEFKFQEAIRVAIVGVTAGGVGLDFSSAQTVVFAELPRSPADLMQAEDRAHRRGQMSAVNVYLFCGKDTGDETDWLRLSASLERVTTVVNGTENTVKGIHVDAVEDEASGQKVRVQDEEVNEWGATQWEGAVDLGRRDLELWGKIVSQRELSEREEVQERTESGPSKAEEKSQRAGQNKERACFEQKRSMEKEDNADTERESPKETGLSLDKVHVLSSRGARRRSFPDENDSFKSSEAPCKKRLFSTSQGASAAPFGGIKAAGKDLKAAGREGKEAGKEGKSAGNEVKAAGKEVNAATKEIKAARKEIKAAEREDDGGVPIGQLLFEISAHTGRIHLYRGGENTASEGGGEPELLGANFQREELAKLRTEDDIRSYDGPLPKLLLTCAAHRKAALRFLEDWAKLRPLYRTRLLGIPLKAPLDADLVKRKGGLKAGGSKKRVVDRGEVGAPLPAGASLREVKWRSIYGEEQKHSQGMDADGNPLCKLCQGVCKHRHARLPHCLTDLFCKRACADLFHTRTSSAFNRQRLFEVERGVCAMCGLDCHKMITTLKGLSAEQRREGILQLAPAFLQHPKKLDFLLSNFCEGNAWHADHIVAVFEGGGECDIENLRTLCVPCHAKVTSEQAKRRASDARKARDHDPKQRKLSFVPRGKKRAKVNDGPRVVVELESDSDASPPRQPSASKATTSDCGPPEESPLASAEKPEPLELQKALSLASSGSHSSDEEFLAFDFRKAGPDMIHRKEDTAEVSRKSDPKTGEALKRTVDAGKGRILSPLEKLDIRKGPNSQRKGGSGKEVEHGSRALQPRTLNSQVLALDSSPRQSDSATRGWDCAREQVDKPAGRWETATSAEKLSPPPLKRVKRSVDELLEYKCDRQEKKKKAVREKHEDARKGEGLRDKELRVTKSEGIAAGAKGKTSKRGIEAQKRQASKPRQQHETGVKIEDSDEELFAAISGFRVEKKEQNVRTVSKDGSDDASEQVGRVGNVLESAEDTESGSKRGLMGPASRGKVVEKASDGKDGAQARKSKRVGRGKGMITAWKQALKDV